MFLVYFEALEFTGGVPYHVLKPVLERASPDQLIELEYYNDYLIEESDELWRFHCNKEFRNKKQEEDESWRDMFMVRDKNFTIKLWLKALVYLKQAKKYDL